MKEALEKERRLNYIALAVALVLTLGFVTLVIQNGTVEPGKYAEEKFSEKALSEMTLKEYSGAVELNQKVSEGLRAMLIALSAIVAVLVSLEYIKFVKMAKEEI